MNGLSVAGSFQPGQPGEFGAMIGEDWCQGRTVFGGLLATAAVRAMQQSLDGRRPLRSVLVAFVAPVSAGEARIEIDLLRSGRSMTSLDARVVQAGQTCTRVTACFGEARETCIEIPGRSRPQVNPPEGIEPMPNIAGITPAFIRHFDMRWVSPLPFSGSKEARILGWIRPQDQASLDAAGLLSLIDAWPPPEMVTQDHPFPLSSVTWQVNVLGAFPEQGVSPDSWWLYESRSTWAGGGYSDSWAVLWGQDGRPVAHSRQLVAEFSDNCG